MSNSLNRISVPVESGYLLPHPSLHVLRWRWAARHPTRIDENDDGSIYADIVQNGGIPLNIIKSI